MIAIELISQQEAEYIFNATRGNNSGIATNVTTINNTQANQ